MKKLISYTFLILLILSTILLVSCNNKNTQQNTDFNPTITIDENGYWVINGNSTNVSAQGKNGNDGYTPVITIKNGYWYIDNICTNVVALGADGYNGSNGLSAYDIAVKNGFLGTEEEWLLSLKGDDGISPDISIDQNGYWVINNEKTNILAKGINGTDGHSPIIKIIDGYWYIDGECADVIAQGKDGFNGASIYELYVNIFGYDGTEEEWLLEVINGTLDVSVKRNVSFDYVLNDLENYPKSISVRDGFTIDLPTPEKEGYDFLGWFTGNDINAGKWTNTLIVDRDISLIAHWQIKSVVVDYYDINDNLLSEQIINYGEDSIPPIPPAVDEKLFIRWDNDTTNHTKNDVIKPVYISQRFSIFYDTDGGSDVTEVSYLVNEIPICPKFPEKEGFIFVEWINTENNEKYNFDEPITTDIRLRAVWSNVYNISSMEDLYTIVNNPNLNYKLVNDLDLNGAEWIPINEFNGQFDGDGHKIYNFQMITSNQNMAFFKKNYGTIKNIKFEDVIINQNYGKNSLTAVVVGVNSGLIDNVYIKDVLINYSQDSFGNNTREIIGLVTAINEQNSIVSNIIGVNNKIKVVYKSKSTGNSGSDEFDAGFCVGRNEGSIMSVSADCDIDVNVDVLGKIDQNQILYLQIGGAVGLNWKNGVVNDVFCDINTTFNLDSEKYIEYYSWGEIRCWCCLDIYSQIGGVVGENYGICKKMASTGKMDGNWKNNACNYGDIYWGGIVGYTHEGSLDVAYSNMSIKTKQELNRGSVGGITGLVRKNASVKNVEFEGEISTEKTDCVGGIVGYNEGSLSNLYSNCNMLNGCSIVAENQSSGVISKYVVFDEAGTVQYKNNKGIISKNYSVNNDNLEEIFNDVFLYGENIYSSEVWGVCNGLSIYLKDFCCENHDFGENEFGFDKYCQNFACGYAEKADS